MPVWIAQIGIIGAVLLLLMMFFLLSGPIHLWTLSLFCGADVSFGSILRTRLRGRDPGPIVMCAVRSVKAGLGVTYAELERHAAAGGDVDRVVRALTIAKGADAPFALAEAAEMDLAGSDPVAWIEEQVRASKPREVPNSVRWVQARQAAQGPRPQSFAVSALSPIRFVVGVATIPMMLVRAKRIARQAALPLSLGDVVHIWTRGANPIVFVSEAARLRRAGIDLKLETFRILAVIGRDLSKIVAALVAARDQGFDLDFDSAAALEVGGEDPMILVEAMSLAKQGGWKLSGADAAELVYAGHDPVRFVREQLTKVSV